MVTTLFSYVALELLDARLLTLYAWLGLESDSIVSIKLFLKLDDGLISLVQSRGQCYHDVPLLKEKLFVPVNLSLPFLNLSALSFNLIQFNLVLLSYSFLLFFKGGPKLGGILDFLASCQHLWVHRFDFIFECALFFLRL